MILTVVGTHDQPFDRLLRAVDALDTSEARIFQIGHSTYRPRNGEVHDFVPPDTLEALMHKARVIVCHGGVGTIRMALAAGKRPVVAARLRRYGEHVDDHQCEIVDSFAQDELIIAFAPEDASGARGESSKDTSLATCIEHAAALGPPPMLSVNPGLVAALRVAIERKDM